MDALKKRSLIMLEDSKQYLAAGIILNNAKEPEAPIGLYNPVLNSLLISIELSLKSVLYHAGIAPKNGHDIGTGLIDAISNGLQISEPAACVVFSLNEPYLKHAPRYSPHSEKILKIMPVPMVLQTATEVVASAEMLIKDKPFAMQYTPLIYDRAVELKAQVENQYQEQIDNVDFNRVYTEDDKPPYALGTVFVTPLEK
ncbi:hypothetical protein [Pseudochrobactrum sp. XF203]|uniref:hypothetical protein n=1 Tax=Pseudochrobactrum sp. XF203 TaxID=2879116 RepID=UPI001CE33934|nr:hypothetical protein [Pseudochrobactrum sp. XF203]UCA44772.1 hypothetical protein LDL70_10320 [Pseudochrobactrum sp. XF203]